MNITITNHPILSVLTFGVISLGSLTVLANDRTVVSEPFIPEFNVNLHSSNQNEEQWSDWADIPYQPDSSLGAADRAASVTYYSVFDIDRSSSTGGNLEGEWSNWAEIVQKPGLLASIPGRSTVDIKIDEGLSKWATWAKWTGNESVYEDLLAKASEAMRTTLAPQFFPEKDSSASLSKTHDKNVTSHTQTASLLLAASVPSIGKAPSSKQPPFAVNNRAVHSIPLESSSFDRSSTINAIGQDAGIKRPDSDSAKAVMTDHELLGKDSVANHRRIFD